MRTPLALPGWLVRIELPGIFRSFSFSSRGTRTLKALPPAPTDRVALALRLLESPGGEIPEEYLPPPPPPPRPPRQAPTPPPPRRTAPAPQRQAPPAQRHTPPPETSAEDDGQGEGEGEDDAGAEEAAELKISDDFSFPRGMTTESIGIVAARGSGKTYTTAVMAEELYLAGLPFLVIDPLGVYWGIRSGSDGTETGMSVSILGGEHGDVPLESGTGRAVARWVIDYRKPAILDLSGFRKAEQRDFLSDLAEELYASCKAPLHLIVDEADLFIPQKPGPDDKRVLAAFEDIVRRGRVRGLGITVVTQRPAVIHKDILTQIGTLIVMRMMGPQDRRAIEDWIKFHGDPGKQRVVLSSLASLPVGTAWVWSPGWLGLLRKIEIRERFTFDSSITPKEGAPRVMPTAWAEVDVEELRETLADAVEHDPNDPKVLKARIAELEKALSEDGAGSGGGLLGRLQKRVLELEHELRAARSRGGGGGGAVPVSAAVLSTLVERLTWLCDMLERGPGGGDDGDGDGDGEGEEPEAEEPPEEEPEPEPVRPASSGNRMKGRRR